MKNLRIYLWINFRNLGVKQYFVRFSNPFQMVSQPTPQHQFDHMVFNACYKPLVSLSVRFGFCHISFAGRGLESLSIIRQPLINPVAHLSQPASLQDSFQRIFPLLPSPRLAELPAASSFTDHRAVSQPAQRPLEDQPPQPTEAEALQSPISAVM